MEKIFLPVWMQKTVGILLIILIVLLCINQIKAIDGTPQTMRISASGKVTAVPDLAIVTLGVESQGTDAVDVKNKNNQKMNQIINFIKQQGVDEKDLQTTGFYASPRYNYVNGQNNLIGYQASQSVTIKIKGIDKSQAQLEKILDGAVNNGANDVQGVVLSFLDTDVLKQSARKQAIEKAKQKAEELADESGLRLGRVINVVEGASDYPAPGPMASFAVRNKSIAPNIEPGSQEVTETVSLIFEVH